MSIRAANVAVRDAANSAQLLRLHSLVKKAAAGPGLGQRLIELVKIRGSMLNGCSFCLDLHTRTCVGSARPNGASTCSAPGRKQIYTDQERAALALTDAMTRLPETQDVPDEVYAQAAGVFTEDQYRAVAWTITMINAFNRLSVTSRKPLHPGPAA